MRLPLIFLAFLAAAVYAQDAPACASACISSALGVVTDQTDCVSQGLDVLDQTLQNGNATASSNAQVAGKACICIAVQGDVNAAAVKCLQQSCPQFEKDVVNALKTVCKGNSKPLDVSDDPRDGTGAASMLNPFASAALVSLAGLLFAL